MELDEIAKLAQKCVQQNPVIVLGSGASAAHKIRGMPALSVYLRQHVVAEEDVEINAWRAIEAALEAGTGLEVTLQETDAPKSLTDKIVRLTWKAIALDDLELLHKSAMGEEAFPLTNLILGLFRSSNNLISIVTPNYDRVAEYAADIADVVHTTGFTPGIIRRRMGANPITYKRGNFPPRTVEIWKVHGSLDWFSDPGGAIVSLPLTNEIPDGFAPLIVTPGISKYERTHDEPFRSAIQGADSVLDRSSAFLCVGYGFRDTHIQPKLVERCRQKNVPIIVLAKELTDEAKDFLLNSAGSEFLAMEEHEGGTKVFTPDLPGGTVVPELDLWSFSTFNGLVF